jgi:hypothetical protein
VAVDVTGLPVAALVVPASTHENRASDLMLEHPTQQGVAGRLELVLVDRGVTAAAARDLSREHDLEAAGSGGTTSNRSSAPFGTPGASGSPTAAWLLPPAVEAVRGHDQSATGWLRVACIATTLRDLSRERARRRPVALVA